MSRPSNRTSIIEAALRVAEAGGVAAVTLDSVAAEAGLTKGGVIYHFPSKSALVEGVHAHLAEAWDAQMTDYAGTDPAEAGAAERMIAYVRASGADATRGELLFIADAETSGEHFAHWARVSERWTPPPPAPSPDGRYDDADMTLFLARLAADGLWSYESVTGVPLSPELRAAVVARIAATLDGSD